jgi:hypothetical protein
MPSPAVSKLSLSNRLIEAANGPATERAVTGVLKDGRCMISVYLDETLTNPVVGVLQWTDKDNIAISRGDKKYITVFPRQSIVAWTYTLDV